MSSTAHENDFNDILQRIDVFTKKFDALMQSNKDAHVQKCICQLDDYGTRIKKEAAKDPRDDKLFSRWIEAYCDLEPYVTKFSSVDGTVEEILNSLRTAKSF
ncbi:MAG: hypothetical protein Q9169_002171 [Polycauliona sp. 2 TL-2023]